MELDYRIQEIRTSAIKCNNVGNEVTFDDKSMIKLNKSNSGMVKLKIDEIVQEMSACAKDSQAYISNTAQFIYNVAEYFERMDEELAKNIKEA